MHNKAIEQKLIDEIEQLKADKAELLDELEFVVSQYMSCHCDHPACGECKDRKEASSLIQKHKGNE